MSTVLDVPAGRAPWSRWTYRAPEWLVAVAVGVAVALLATIPFLQNHAFYYGGDNPESFVPLWHHLGEELRAGRWQTMEPGGWTGGNYAGESAYALWNPVLLVDYLVVSLFDNLAVAAALVQISYLALLGIAAYLLCREYGARRLAAAVVAIGVPLSGFTLFYEASGWPAGLTAFTWVTWFWWAAHRQSRGRLWPLVTFVIGALGITTGNPYAALGIIVVLIGIGVELLARRELRGLAGLVLTGLCVGATAALVFLPLVGSLPVTDRQQIAGIVNDTFLVPHLGDMAASSAPTYLPAILNFNGAVVERLPSTYFIWFAGPLLPWVQWRRVRRLGAPPASLFVITAIFAVLALGPSNLWLFRWPIRLIEYCYLGLAVLLARALSPGLVLDHVRRRSAATAGIIGAGAYLSFAVRPDAAGLHFLVGAGVVVLVGAAVIAFRRAEWRAMAVVLVVGTLLVVTYQTRYFPRDVTDELVANQSGNQSAYPASNRATTPRSVSLVERASGTYRGAVLQLAVETSLLDATREQTGELLFGNETLMSGHDSVVRYSGIGFQKFSDALCMDYRGQVCPDGFTRVWREAGDTGRPLIDLLRVDTLVIDAHLFPGPAAAPPPAGWSVADRDSVRTVWVRDLPSPYAGRLSWASPGIAVTRDAGRDLTESVSVRADAPGELVFARLAWPGYRATLDGRPVEPRDGTAGLLTVPVPAGSHVVTLTFRSPGLGRGLALLAVAALLSLIHTAFWVILRWRRRRGATGGPGGIAYAAPGSPLPPPETAGTEAAPASAVNR